MAVVEGSAGHKQYTEFRGREVFTRHCHCVMGDIAKGLAGDGNSAAGSCFIGFRRIVST